MRHASDSQPLPICPFCGAPHRPGIHVCPQCGRPLHPSSHIFELLVIRENTITAHIPLPTAVIAIGRATDNTILLDDPKISRHHLRLTWNGAAFVAEDVGSSGGTLLNGVSLRAPTALRPGDTLTLGDTMLRLGIVSEVEAVLAPPVLPAAPLPPSLAAPSAHASGPMSAPPYPPPSAWPYSSATGQEPSAFAQSYSPHAPPPPGMAPYPLPPSGVSQMPTPLSRHSLSPGLLAIAAIAVVFVVVGGIAAALLFGFGRSAISSAPPANSTPLPPANLGPTTPTATPAPLTMTIAPIEQTTVAADGQPHIDSHGASLTVPGDALEEGSGIELMASAAQGSLADALNQAFAIETPFYSVVAEHDGRGRATLALPAAGPDSRVAVVIDNEYLALLDLQPTDGMLRIDTLIAPKTLPDAPAPGIARDGTIHYVVLRPKPGSAASPAETHNLLGLNLAPRRAYAADVYRECLEWTTNTRCRTNGRVHVMWRLTVPLQTADADAIISQVDVLMKAYAGRGFTAAASSASIFVIVDPSVAGPVYSAKNGIIYLPMDSASSISTNEGRRDLAHELFHWIQDEEYVMTLSALSGARTWWLETTAENGVFLIDDSALEFNLQHYGQTTVDRPAFLGFQAAPFTWSRSDEARYIHAQLLRVNMCDSDACAISEQGMIRAINDGTYPLNDAAFQANIRANLDDYARYLLGVAPERTNTTISLHNVVRTGDTFGDVIWVKQNILSAAQEFFLESSSGEPQIRQETPKDRPPEYIINAPIERAGVYPLQVVSGGTGRPTWPVMLIIEPGIELLYRLDDEPVVHHPGDAQLVLGPIHATMGYRKVRVVALGRDETNTFKAAVRLVDLQGDWLLIPGDVRSNSVVCSSDNTSVDPAKLTQLSAALSEGMAQRGSYTWQGLNELAFALDPGMTLTDDPDDHSQIEAIGLIGPDNIQGMLRLVVPPPETGGMQPGVLLLVAMPSGILAWRTRRRVLMALTILILGAFLAGCVGVSVHGSVDTRYILGKLEYVGKGDTLGEPLWRISKGAATTDVDLTITVATQMIGDEQPQEQTTQCKGRVVHDITVEIYKDGVISLQDDGE
ncbi:FHA domain containing protein [Roseiflexus castenholzii DSM 13941]|uniref:FHA domain containing protein n=1 Tax=Roseiflexus castenholzii (strain DSM 13941 / HLO8) TaxID=383372 RepID=A7NQ13_ROSCS|nr:FHA domain containing protein [Roseiflexus castenholzii DSM 13941]